MRSFTLYLNVPSSLQKRVRYAADFLSQAVGCNLTLVRGDAVSAVDISYGVSLSAKHGGCIFLPHHSAYYKGGASSFRMNTRDGFCLWEHSESIRDGFDVLGSIYRLINLLDERQIDRRERDSRGNFKISALSSERRKACREPLVDHAVAWFRKRLEEHFFFEPEPRWPGGKRFAMLVTHDTDAVALSNPREIIYNCVKLCKRRESVDRVSMIKTGLNTLLRKTEDPFSTFLRWRNFEKERSIRSCFFLFAKSPGDSFRLNDCRSGVLDRGFDKAPIREMNEEGWEFGYHAPITAKDSLDSFIWGKCALEESLGISIFGLRHHYWNLDWFAPHRTFRKQLNAGFRYDMSIAWRDSAGFRAGTCLPYRPFDSIQQKALELIEIPTTVMDAHLLANTSEKQLMDVRETIEKVKEAGGVLVFDWHTETGCNQFIYRGYLDALAQIIAEVADDSGAWITTPWKLAKHWHQRRSRLIDASH